MFFDPWDVHSFLKVIDDRRDHITNGTHAAPADT